MDVSYDEFCIVKIYFGKMFSKIVESNVGHINMLIINELQNQVNWLTF